MKWLSWTFNNTNQGKNCKFENRKLISVHRKIKSPAYRIDQSLNQYDHVILFSEKVEAAKETIKKNGLPTLEQIRQKTGKKGGAFI